MFLNENHRYDFQKIASPIEQFLLDHIIKFLSPDTKLEVQYPISTISGNFRADIALINKNKIVILECDGKDYHTKDLDDWYDEWRDTLILSERKANSIYRIKGRDIYNHIYAVLSIVNNYDSELFNAETMNRLPPVIISENGMRKCCESAFCDANENVIDYTIEVKRRDLRQDFDPFWLKYLMFSMLFPEKNVYELITAFKSQHYSSETLVRKLNSKYPALNLKNENQLIEEFGLFTSHK